MSKPTLILVHGSWHSPKHWDPIAKDLEGHGYRCVPVALPSTQSPDLPPATLTDDTSAIRSAVINELDSDNDVVVVAHSYGGCPANNALKGLDKKTRSAAGHSRCVQSIIFIASAPLPVGMSFIDSLGGKPLPIHDLRLPDFAWVGPPGPEYYFYNTLEPAEAKRWADELRPQSWAAYTEPTTYAAFLDFSCFYLRCRRDQALPWDVQEGILESIQNAGGVVKAGVVDSDHTPFIGKCMKETSEYIRRVARGEE